MTLFWIGGLSVLALSLLCDLLSGGVHLSLSQTVQGLSGKEPYGDIIRSIRLPRILTALLAGASLSLGGAQMQAIFRNPLADPHIMGVSGGAALGAAIVTLCLGGASVSGIPVALAAALGAVASSLLVVAVSLRTDSGGTLLIFGVMLGFILSAVSSIIQYTADEESLKLFYSWSAGSFSGTGYREVAIMGAALVLALALSLSNIKGMDAILFGDEFVSSFGGSPSRIRILSLASCCLLSGAVTAFCGPLGFVGIVSPHIARYLTGSSLHKRIIPSSLLCGAIVSLLSDALSQSFSIPLPVGSTMAIIGIPIILMILLRK